jgi:hypothetical protein
MIMLAGVQRVKVGGAIDAEICRLAVDDATLLPVIFPRKNGHG